MKFLIKFFSIIGFIFLFAFQTTYSAETVGVDTAKEYLQDIPKLMMSAKKNKELIDEALNKIETECCADNFEEKNKINEIKQSLQNCIKNECFNKTYVMWAIKKPRKLIVLNQIDELETLLLKNEKVSILDNKSREDDLLNEKNKAIGNYEKLLVTYNKLEEDNKTLKLKIEKLLKNYETKISKLEEENKILNDKNNELYSLMPTYVKRKIEDSKK